MRFWIVPTCSTAMLSFVAITSIAAAETSHSALEPKPTTTQSKPVVSWRLPNGLTVMFQEDHRQPRVGISVAYKVGLSNDPPEYRGLAHLTEHLMFQGSANVPRQGFFKITESRGATHHGGYADLDRTVYERELPSREFATGLWLESDRMAYLLKHITPEAIEVQREVIRNEWRERLGPSALANRHRLIARALYPPTHPYHEFGDYDAEAIDLSAVQWFFQKYYGPDNATLGIVGDVSEARARKLVSRYFGSIKKTRRAPAPAKPWATKRARELKVTVRARTTFEGVILAWQMPPRGSRFDTILAIIGEYLRDRRRGVERKLIRQGVAVGANIGGFHRRLASLFIVEAFVARGKSADKAQRVIEGELAKITQSAFERRRFAAARDRVEARLRRALDRYIVRATHLSGTGLPIEKRIDRLKSVTAEEAARVARHLLAKNRRIVARVKWNPNAPVGGWVAIDD